MSESLLEVRDVHAGYGPVPVLDGVSLNVGACESIGLFGPNGHGKSTLLRTVSGLLRATEGDVVFDGQSIVRARPSAIVAAGLVHAQQGNTLFGSMNVAETLELSPPSCRVPDPSAIARWGRCTRCSRDWPSVVDSSPARSPAVSARCSRSAAR